jgi:hypothetical protein
MGRTILIVVILVSSIYAGIIINVQNQMYKLPSVMVDNSMRKEAENVSDFALRTAVRNAAAIGLTNEDNLEDFTTVYNNYKIGNCTIDSIRFNFAETVDKYQALTYISGDFQGKHINYPAEIAYNYPVVNPGPTPDAQWSSNRKHRHGDHDDYDDERGRIHASSHGMEEMTRGHGPDGRRAFHSDGGRGWLGVEDNPILQVDSTFSLSVFAKFENNANYGSLVWLASDPYDHEHAHTGHPGHNLRFKPTAGIYYTKSDRRMHYVVTLTNHRMLEVTMPYTTHGQHPHTTEAWHHFGLTYTNNAVNPANGLVCGRLRAYYNGAAVGDVYTIAADGTRKTIKAMYGLNIGRHDLRALSGHVIDADGYLSGHDNHHEGHHYHHGVMDFVSFWRSTITNEDMYNIYMGRINPSYMSYIRD